MKNRLWTIWGYIFTLFLLNGCKSSISYNSDLFKPEQANCWPCKMYMQAFNAIKGTMDAVLPLIAENTLSILKVVLPIWLMFKILPWFLSPTTPNFKKDISEIIRLYFHRSVCEIFCHKRNKIQRYGDQFLQSNSFHR